MLQTDKINEAARQVASANLRPETIVSASSEPSVDSEGRDALRITVVVKPETVADISGDKLLDVLVQTQARLQREGEERPITIEYATPEEVEQSGSARPRTSVRTSRNSRRPSARRAAKAG
jgi:hypothetical protein